MLKPFRRRHASFVMILFTATAGLISCGSNNGTSSSSVHSSSQSVSSSEVSSQSSSSVAVIQQNIGVTDDRVRVFGRIDKSSSSSRTLAWQGSSVGIRFLGNVQSVTFNQVSGVAYFDVLVDGNTVGALQARTGAVSLAPYLNGDNSAWRTLELVKRSEASAGTATVGQFSVTAAVTKMPAKAYDRQWLFFGDSITAGACSEDGSQDQWDDRSTHNALVSYAAQAASTLNAQYQNIAISGVGISVGYQPYTALDIWDRYYPDPNSAKASLGDFAPDTIFLNYGENDDSYSSNQGQAFPADYTSRYLQMLNQVRQQYPDAKIVILRGGMWGGANSARLRGPLDQVVSQFTAQDSNAYHFAFNHWSSLHPRTDDHRIMAEELVSWIQSRGW